MWFWEKIARFKYINFRSVVGFSGTFKTRKDEELYAVYAKS